MVAITKSLCFSFLILASFATLFAVADARRIYVGGNGVWDVNPKESYNTWAGRNRFLVNDTLYFTYAKGSDSVQRVMNVDFESCNINNPLQNFDNGEAEVTLNRSGPFYFISGNQDHCFKGQKFIAVVLAVRNPPAVPISPAKAPSTAQPPKAHSPVSPIAPAKPPSTAQPPKSHSPVSPIAPAKPPSTAQPPKSHSPVSPIAPAKPPSTVQPPKSHSPISPIAPAKPPSTAQPPNSHSPVSPIAPAKPPSAAQPPKSHSPVSPVSPANPPSTVHPPKSPSPSSSSPAKPPTSAPSPDVSPVSPAPEQSPPLSPSPTSDNIKAPAPSPKNAAGGVAVTSVMTTVLSVAFTVLIFA